MLTKNAYDNLTACIFSLEKNKGRFESLAVEIFHLQYVYNNVYRDFTDNLGIRPEAVQRIDDIPFLPIELYKSKEVISFLKETGHETVFTSSGTTQSGNSLHYVRDVGVYAQSFTNCFRAFFGEISGYCMLALLPSYLEQGSSSLVYMADSLIAQSRNALSGFYLNKEELFPVIEELKKKKQKTILLGVSYALLDLAETGVKLDENFIVMETGGMKGRRKELLKEELHAILKNSFGIRHIASEYGMTELLSQAYSLKDGLFQCPPWMKALSRDVNDPFTYISHGRTGGMNIIDLANINSCSFIATQDLGRVYEDGSFEVIGRFDNSDIRGCNLLVN